VLSDYSERCAEARRLDNQVFQPLPMTTALSDWRAQSAYARWLEKNWLVGLRVDRGPAFEILDSGEIIFIAEGVPIIWRYGIRSRA